jgi:EmrB/QacA subfamily drug resistance transporter
LNAAHFGKGEKSHSRLEMDERVEPLNMKTARELDRKSRVYVIVSALLALFLGAMDALVMSAAMPTIVADLGGLQLYSWVYSAFFLANAVSLPVIGKMADLYKTKILFVFSIGLFIASSIAAGLSGSMKFLVLMRVFQGIGAGGNLALVYIVLSDVALPGKRAKTLALASFIWGISSVLGPSVGGFIATYFSWRWIFFINVPLGLLSITGIGFLFVELRQKKQKIDLDIAGVLTLSGLVLGGLTIVMIGGREYAWGSKEIILLGAVTVAMGGGFYLSENRAAEPILDLRFFKIRGFAFSNGAVFLCSFAIFSLIAYAPLFIQGALGKNPLQVGTAMLFLSLGWSVSPILLSQFLHKIGNRASTGLGTLLMAGGGILTLTFDTTTSMGECFLAFSIVGWGMGFVTLSTLLEVQGSLRSEDLGVATSSQQFSRTLGGTIGAGVSGGVVTARLMGRLENVENYLPPDLLARISDNMENIFRPEFLSTLTTHARSVLQNAVVDGVSAVFRLVLAGVFMAFIFALLLPGGGKDPTTET